MTNLKYPIALLPCTPRKWEWKRSSRKRGAGGPLRTSGGKVGFIFPISSCILLLTLLLLPILALAKPTDYFPPPDSQGGWRTLKDAASIRKLAGMDLARLEQAYDFTQRCSQNGGLLVVRHGYLVYEKYYGGAHRSANPDMASTGK